MLYGKNRQEKNLVMWMKRYSVIIIALFITAGLHSATLILRSGKIVKGKVVTQDSRTLTYKNDSGKTVILQKKEILKVVYKDINEDEAARIRESEKKREKELAQKQKELAEQRAREEELEREKARELLERSKKTAQKESGKSGVTRNGAIWRSAVLPGWGQYADGRKKEAIALGSLFWVSGISWYNKNREMLNAARDLGQMNNPYNTFTPLPDLSNPVSAVLYSEPMQSQQHTVDRHYREARSFALLTLIYYSINVADAAFYHSSVSNKTTGSLSRSDVLWRSAVLPGWGQIRDGRRGAAYGYGGSFLFAVVSWYSKHTEMKKASEYQGEMYNPYHTWVPLPAITDPLDSYLFNQRFEDQRATVNRLYSESRSFALLAGVIYMMNVFDAWYFHKSPASASLIMDFGNSSFAAGSSYMNDSWFRAGMYYRF